MVFAPAMYRCQGANLCCIFFRHQDERPSLPQPEILRILSFDAAKTMCRLASLYKSLSDVEIIKLRRHVIRSKGVAYLNSKQECFLLNLACAERLEDLDLAAASVSRLSSNCVETGLKGFEMVYEDMKNGVVDVRKLDQYGTKGIEKDIEKMERLVSSTRDLHISMESLVEMEASEKKIQRWRSVRSNHGLKVKVECFNDRIAYHRRQVQHYKQNSLWNQTFDKVVSLMSRIICIVYARLSSVFGSLIMRCIKSNNNLENCYSLLIHRELYMTNNALFQQTEEPFKKRPKGHALKKPGAVQFPNRHALRHVAAVNHSGDKNKAVAKTNKVFRLAPPTTVGGAGLSQRYANVILFTERCMHAAAAIGEEARVALFDMLPERLKVKVRAKLRSQWLKWEENSERAGGEKHLGVAARWRKTVEEVMKWLSPVAQDTVRWQAERNLEKQKFDTKPTVLLLQTLHYSDLEKVEGAIVELLVGLSCIYWYQKEW